MHIKGIHENDCLILWRETIYARVSYPYGQYEKMKCINTMYGCRLSMSTGLLVVPAVSAEEELLQVHFLKILQSLLKRNMWQSPARQIPLMPSFNFLFFCLLIA
ncbi:hypothetical protein EO92_02285 [Methanosarcina sp. 2.H.A.1B.4]|nr:hypothetical protein EO92_02285 [Methanosarcina sp. 2.H.A.1B.4]